MTKMADEHGTNQDNQENLHFYLHRFDRELPLSKIKSVNISFQTNRVISLDKSGRLDVLRLDVQQGNPSGNALQDVTRFSQVHSQSKKDTDAIGHLFVIEEALKLSWYRMKEDSVYLMADIGLQSLINEDDVLEDTEILASYDDQVLLCFNNQLLVCITTTDKHLKKNWDIEVDASLKEAQTFSVTGDKFAVLHHTKSISLYSLVDGKQIDQVNIQHLDIAEDSLQKWTVSFDLNKIFFVLQDGSLKYTDLFPTGYQRKLTYPHPNKSLHTCKYGDRVWKDRLATLHGEQSSETSLFESHVSFSNEASVKLPRTSVTRRTTGFLSKEKVANCLAVRVIPAPEGISGYSVDDLCIDPSCMSVVYVYNDVSILCQWNFQNRQWTKFRFKTHQKVILSEIPSLPHMVLTSQHLLCVITDCKMGQEEFISEVMVYGGAALADKVCHINKWGRCTIPINTLDAGLKHRQIDTVSFFLKSKENFFSSTKEAPLSSESPSEFPYWTAQCSHLEHLLQLDPAFNLLLHNVRDTVMDKHAQIFGRQVLDITMDFLYGLLLDGYKVAERLTEPHEKEDLNKATDKLLMYIEEARACVRQFEDKMSVSRTGSVSADSMSGTSMSAVSEDTMDFGREPIVIEKTFQEWDKMDIETVIEDGIINNQIPALQHFLKYRDDHSYKTFSQIKAAGLSFAVNHIISNNMKKSKELILKLGFSVPDKLWEIALHSLDMKLFTSITDELLHMTTLTTQQVSMVTFLKEMQNLYPRRDFDNLKGQHQHVKDSESHIVYRVKSLVNPSPVIDLTDECGSISVCSSPQGEGQSINYDYYSEIMLHWIEDWDETTRDWIRLDVILLQIGADISMFNIDVVWDYMQMNNLSREMITWIHKSFHDVDDQTMQIVQADWPVSHLGPIPPDYVNRTTMCTECMREQILIGFAMHGIFNQAAHDNFEILLKQLSLSGGVLRIPHPLQKCSTINIEEFHMKLIYHCVQHSLADFLWIYCNIHRLNSQLLQDASCELDGDTWYHVFIHFYAVTQERNDWKKAMMQCSLMNASVVWGPDLVHVSDLLQSGHVITTMATLMYSSHQLNQVTFVTQQLEAFDGLCSETVERAVQMYPKLHVTLFPASTTDSPHTDVSVYQLLQGNSPFDPSRLFGWHLMNTCIGEDADKEMPYFSNSSLVSKFGYIEHLKYTYYLKQGRPSFAFISFLAEEFKNGGPTLSSKRVAVGMGTSMCIGIKNFSHPHVSSACVMFQELMGYDSLLLRTYLQVGNEILIHKNNAVTGPMEKRRELTKQNEVEVVDLLLRSLQSVRRYSPEVLQALEAAILAGITKDRLSNSLSNSERGPSKDHTFEVWSKSLQWLWWRRSLKKLLKGRRPTRDNDLSQKLTLSLRLSTSFESGQRWIVAVLFCHLVGLPYTTVFLESCAQTNKWLPFIWFSQMHQYSKEQLLGLLHYFKSAHLQEHLRYVIVNASNRSTQEVNKKSTVKKRSDLLAKDVRMTLYTKIGVKDRDSDISTTSDEEEAHLFPIHQEPNNDENAVFQITYDGSPSDVFGVVFAAQTSKCQWKSLLVYSVTLRNPIFAELSACLQDAQTLHCLCGWLVAMMDVIEHALFLENHGKLLWRYHLEQLDKIIKIYIRNKWGSVLVTGFDIFQQNSPLLPFLQFYAEFTEKKNFSKCRLYLNEFKQSFFQFHNERPAKTNLVVGDSAWLEKMTYHMIQYLLTNTTNIYEVTELLRILDSECVTLVFKTEDPDYRRQFKMMVCLQGFDNQIQSISYRALLSEHEDTSKQECLKVISQLTKCQLYDDARNFANIANIPAEHVTLVQIKSQKEALSVSELWNSKSARVKFYRDCLDLANKHSISSVEITRFFLKEAKLIESASEKSDLLQMCLEYVTEDKNEGSDEWTQIYIKMWTYKIQEQIEMSENKVTQSKRSEKWMDDRPGKTLTDKKRKQDLLCVGKMPSSAVKPTDLSDKILLDRYW